MGTSKKADLLQAELVLNTPKEFKVGGKEYKIHRLGNWVSSQMSKLIIEAELVYGDGSDRESLLKSVLNNRKLAPKCISLMMLKSTIKVKLFHWFKWRQLHYFYSQEDYKGILDNILNDQDTMFFFQNMALLQSYNQLESQVATESTKSIIAKHGLEGQTT